MNDTEFKASCFYHFEKYRSKVRSNLFLYILAEIFKNRDEVLLKDL